MYSSTRLAFNYLNYLRRSSNGKGHGIHSPFVYEFVTEVLNDEREFYPFAEIESRRSELERDHSLIEVEDYGKSPRSVRNTEVAGIARRAVSTPKFGRLLFRMVNHYQPAQVIELGTSLGISGAYLASANRGSGLITLEGSASIARVAKETFNKLNLPQIRQITGNFDETLSAVIASAPPAGLVYIDGNHRKGPLLNYFQQFLNKRPATAVFILHDIHWSPEMEDAWRIIRDCPELMLTIDLFSAGLVFFRDTFRVKQHFTIRF
ncbi:MAG TPA: class I SAM-dependent methyltransferase [Puia sp.]|jgi:predicted O-methyltransferase YrrM